MYKVAFKNKLQNLTNMDFFLILLKLYFYIKIFKKITDLLEREERERRLKEEEEAKSVVKNSPLKKKKLFK
jgi:hypothetical protein